MPQIILPWTSVLPNGLIFYNTMIILFVIISVSTALPLLLQWIPIFNNPCQFSYVLIRFFPPSLGKLMETPWVRNKFYLTDRNISWRDCPLFPWGPLCTKLLLSKEGSLKLYKAVPQMGGRHRSTQMSRGQTGRSTLSKSAPQRTFTESDLFLTYEAKPNWSVRATAYSAKWKLSSLVNIWRTLTSSRQAVNQQEDLARA